MTDEHKPTTDECEICEAPAVGKFLLELEFDRKPHNCGSYEVEEFGRPIFELFVCEKCKKDPSIIRVVCELAAEYNTPND